MFLVYKNTNKKLGKCQIFLSICANPMDPKGWKTHLHLRAPAKHWAAELRERQAEG